MSFRICADAGHGGDDPGAVGQGGLRECDVVLSMAMTCVPAFVDAGYTAFLTRAFDTTLSLAARVQYAKDERADLFISFHANAAAAASAGGFEVFTSPGYTQADPVACSIFEMVRQRFPGLRARVDTSDGDVDKEARFYVLVNTPMPAVLVEAAFISNPVEEAWLADPGWRLSMVGAIVTGVRSAVGTPHARTGWRASCEETSSYLGY